MIRILLLVLISFFSVGIQAKMSVALSDQKKQALEEKQALAEQEKNINRQQEQAEVKIPENSDALKK